MADAVTALCTLQLHAESSVQLMAKPFDTEKELTCHCGLAGPAGLACSHTSQLFYCHQSSHHKLSPTTAAHARSIASS